jgi:hypothetical protein
MFVEGIMMAKSQGEFVIVVGWLEAAELQCLPRRAILYLGAFPRTLSSSS